MVQKVLSALSVEELRKELSSRGLDSRGNKATLTQRLEESLREEGIAEPQNYKFDISDPITEIMVMMANLTESMTELKRSNEGMQETVKQLEEAVERREEQREARNEKRHQEVIALQQAALAHFKMEWEERAVHEKGRVDIEFGKMYAELGSVKESIRKIEPVAEEVIETGEKFNTLSQEVEKLTDAVRRIKANSGISCSGGHGKHIKPPLFDGSTPWSIFERQFNTAAETNGWGDEEKIANLILALRGQAAEVLESQEKHTFTELKKTLAQHYGNSHLKQAMRYDLKQRRQGSAETLQQLMADIQRQVRMAYPEYGPEQTDSKVTETFLGSLRNQHTQEYLSLAPKPTSQETLASALEIEALRKMFRQDGQVRTLQEEAGSSSEKRSKSEDQLVRDVAMEVVRVLRSPVKKAQDGDTKVNELGIIRNN